MRRAEARPVAQTSPTSANVWSGMVKNSARPVNDTSAPAERVPSSARRPPTQMVSARNNAGITAASAFHALSRRASAMALVRTCAVPSANHRRTPSSLPSPFTTRRPVVMSAATADASASRCCCSVARRSYGRHSGTSTRRHGGRPTRTRPPRMGDTASMPAPTAKNVTIAPEPRHMRSAIPPTRCASLAASDNSAPGSTSTPPRGSSTRRVTSRSTSQRVRVYRSSAHRWRTTPATACAIVTANSRAHTSVTDSDGSVVDDPVDRKAQRDRQNGDRTHPGDARPARRRRCGRSGAGSPSARASRR